MRFSFCCALALVAAAAASQEHQRLESSDAAVHRWELGLDSSLTPLGQGTWYFEALPQVSYSFLKTWSASVSAPYSWFAVPGGLIRRWGDPAVQADWSGGAPGRWTFSAGLSYSREAEKPVRPSAELSFQTVRDPVILGYSGALSWPEGGGLLVSASFFFQEVLNDTQTWSFSASPRVFLNAGEASVGLSVSWRAAWYEGDFSLSSGASSSGGGWSWTASGRRAWELR